MAQQQDKAPAVFIARYNRIMNGEEKLDTVIKLKDFWLFAIKQGWPEDYETRAHMAALMFNVPIASNIFNTKQVQAVCVELESYSVVTIFPEQDSPTEHTTMSDAGWGLIQYYIDKIEL